MVLAGGELCWLTHQAANRGRELIEGLGDGEARSMAHPHSRRRCQHGVQSTVHNGGDRDSVV